MAKEIYKEKGLFKGFYAGSTPNLARILFKNFYRFPLLVTLPDYFKANLPLSLSSSMYKLKTITAFSIAAIESLLICPFERLKTYLMTA